MACVASELTTRTEPPAPAPKGNACIASPLASKANAAISTPSIPYSRSRISLSKVSEHFLSVLSEYPSEPGPEPEPDDCGAGPVGTVGPGSTTTGSGGLSIESIN